MPRFRTDVIFCHSGQVSHFAFDNYIQQQISHVPYFEGFAIFVPIRPQMSLIGLNLQRQTEYTSLTGSCYLFHSLHLSVGVQLHSQVLSTPVELLQIVF